MLYSHDHGHLYKHICIQNYNDTIITSDTVLRKIYLSYYLKGLCVRGSWRPNRTATYWPHSYGHQRFFPVLQGFSTGSPGAQLTTGCWLSLPHLVSKLSDLQTRWPGVPRAPSAGCWFSLPYLVSKLIDLQTNWHPVFTELYNSSTPTPLEWHVSIVIERK